MENKVIPIRKPIYEPEKEHFLLAAKLAFKEFKRLTAERDKVWRNMFVLATKAGIEDTEEWFIQQCMKQQEEL